MKIKLYYPAFDPALIELHKIKPSKRYGATILEFPNGFLDGLVSKEVALIDFDPESGELANGPGVHPPDPGNKMHKLSVDRAEFKKRPKSIVSIQTLCFGTVIRTIRLVEKPWALGRKLKWSFDGDQLFVVPRAGFGANAFYHRDSHSLQFLVVADQGRPSEGKGGQQQGRFTALSPDIVAHETAHAIVDGIAPGLYDAAAPESLALHEAIADLTALIVSLQTGFFVSHVLDHWDGDLDAVTVGAIAEEIGALSAPSGGLDERNHGLRNLSNNFALPRADGSIPEGMEQVSSLQPHTLSEVLSGALFSFMMEVFVKVRAVRAKEEGISLFSASGFAVAMASRAVASLIYRALDYLPPGEISFADFGRAMLAADRIAFSSDEGKERRELLIAELVRRNIGTRASLTSFNDFVPPDVRDQDLERFTEGRNDWLIYDFVNRFRSLFRIPDNTPFKVHEPEVLLKSLVPSPKQGDDEDDDELDEDIKLRELLIKVSWQTQEEHRINGSLRSYLFTFGTTVSFDLDSKTVITRLSTNADGKPEDHDISSQRRHREGRRALLENWLDNAWLEEGSDSASAPQLIEHDGVFKVRNMAHQLHFARDDMIRIPDWLDLEDHDG